MADGKWIRGLAADTPLQDAARLVLEARLGVVTENLPRAIQESQRDPEFVHQLRVGTRRADASLRIFRSCLPGRVYRAARDRLRKLRRAAGEARDWDVFLLALERRGEDVEAKELTGLDVLAGVALGHRAVAQGSLEAADAHGGEGFAEYVQEVLASLREPEGDSLLGGLAREAIHARLEEFDQAAAGDLQDFEQLHQVRILGKRLRYAMEVFGDCFPPSFRELHYPLVEEMQEILGRANDSRVAVERLAALREQLKAWPKLRERARKGLEGLLRFHQRRVPQEKRRFLRWLVRWREAGVEAVTA